MPHTVEKKTWVFVRKGLNSRRFDPVSDSQTVYLSLGSNAGDRSQFLSQATGLLRQNVSDWIRSSEIYETEPWGNMNQPLFLNQVLEIRTGLSATDLMKELLEIEKVLGRKRAEIRWQERTIDLDILFYGREIIHLPGLTVPHPELHNRRFVLEPMHEIAPDFVHPVSGKTIASLLLECPDRLKINKIARF